MNQTAKTRQEGVPDETVVYIERMCVEMRGLAAQSGLDFLAYLLDVAREEAASNLLQKVEKDVS